MSSTLNEILRQGSDSLTRQEAERDHVKELKTRLVEDHGIPSKKVANRIIRAFHKGNIEEELEGDEKFEEVIEKVRNGSV